MIIDKEVYIKLSNRTIKRYRNHFKDKSLSIGNKILVPVNTLTKGSHIKVLCKCDVCNKEKKIMYQKYLKNIKNGGYYACSSKCAQSKVKKTSNKKWGVEHYTKTKHYLESVIETNNKKYGSDYYFLSKEGKSNIKNKIINKYGVENVFSSDIVKEKIIKTNNDKYGFDNPSKSDIIKDKISKKLKLYWDDEYKKYYKKNHNLKIIDFNIKKNEYKVKCEKGHSYEIERKLLNNRLLLKSNTCLVCNPYNDSNYSGQEIEVRNYIESITDKKVYYNRRDIINPYELDIYIPKLNIAVEYNGLYWHSSKNKNNNYHYNKHNLCKNLGLELFQIWEDDWLYKNKIIKSILKNKISNSDDIIWARNCEVKFINFKESTSFLEKNHLMGKCMSKYNLGLFYKEKLVSVMTFGKKRKPLNTKHKKDHFEMIRFANKLNTNIVGGASKLLNFFKKNISFSEIVTYFDKSFGYNNLYEKVGFEYDGETSVGYKYIVGGKREHRYNYTKKSLVEKGFDKNKTEEEIMKDLGFYRIYDVGNYKYILKN